MGTKGRKHGCQQAVIELALSNHGRVATIAWVANELDNQWTLSAVRNALAQLAEKGQFVERLARGSYRFQKSEEKHQLTLPKKGAVWEVIAVNEKGNCLLMDEGGQLHRSTPHQF